MPAVAAKKPTAYREGRADKTKKPSIEIEINPEGEEEEEGMEGQEMDAAKTSRKRSAKGAKSTKAPMDGDCGCGGGKAKKCTCDGGCGGYAKKMDCSDALTPQEYLAACDLGIQGRSRSYIRARLDAAERLDVKCGASGIAPGKKCTKGKGTAARAKGKGKNKRSQNGPMYNAASQWQANMRAANRAQLGAAAWNSGGPVGVRAAKSIWADGFDPVDERSDLKCGKGSISKGEKCTKGAAQSVPSRTERRGAYGTSGLGGDPFSYRNMATRSAMFNAAALSAAGGLLGGAKGAAIGAAIGGVAGAGSGALQAGINRVTSRAAKRRRLTQEFERPIAAEFKRKMEGEKSKIRKVRARMGEIDYKTSMKLSEGYDRINRETRGRYGADSIWAEGFQP